MARMVAPDGLTWGCTMCGRSHAIAVVACPCAHQVLPTETRLATNADIVLARTLVKEAPGHGFIYMSASLVARLANTTYRWMAIHGDER